LTESHLCSWRERPIFPEVGFGFLETEFPKLTDFPSFLSNFFFQPIFKSFFFNPIFDGPFFENIFFGKKTRFDGICERIFSLDNFFRTERSAKFATYCEFFHYLYPKNSHSFHSSPFPYAGSK